MGLVIQHEFYREFLAEKLKRSKLSTRDFQSDMLAGLKILPKVNAFGGWSLR
jgi:hypothetical protein